jgi:hypothetical protein
MNEHSAAYIEGLKGANNMNRSEILDAVKKTICNDRQDVHGNPEDTHELIANLWSAYAENSCFTEGHFVGFDGQDVAVMMCLFKIARHAMNPKHLDSLVDLIGYAAIAVELGDYQAEDLK